MSSRRGYERAHSLYERAHNEHARAGSRYNSLKYRRSAPRGASHRSGFSHATTPENWPSAITRVCATSGNAEPCLTDLGGWSARGPGGRHINQPT